MNYFIWKYERYVPVDWHGLHTDLGITVGERLCLFNPTSIPENGYIHLQHLLLEIFND